MSYCGERTPFREWWFESCHLFSWYWRKQQYGMEGVCSRERRKHPAEAFQSDYPKECHFQGNRDDSTLPGLLQAKLQSSPFPLGRDKIQSHTVQTSDAVHYFQTRACAWIQTHPAKGQKKSFDKYRFMPVSYFSLTATSGPQALLGFSSMARDAPAWGHILHATGWCWAASQSRVWSMPWPCSSRSCPTRLNLLKTPDKKKKTQTTLTSFPSK